MFKTTIAAAAAAVAFVSAAALGPYVNVDANAGWTGDDYTSTTTDIHVGYEGKLELLPTTCIDLLLSP